MHGPASALASDGKGIVFAAGTIAAGTKVDGWLAASNRFGHASAAAAGTCCKLSAKDCDDGKVCTGFGCDATKGCTSTPVPDGRVCKKGSGCLLDAVCAAGVCQDKLGPCDDKNACTADSCDTTTQKCTSTPIADGKPCDDGDVCVAGTTCQAGKCGGAAASALWSHVDKYNGEARFNRVVELDNGNVVGVGWRHRPGHTTWQGWTRMRTATGKLVTDKLWGGTYHDSFQTASSDGKTIGVAGFTGNGSHKKHQGIWIGALTSSLGQVFLKYYFINGHLGMEDAFGIRRAPDGGWLATGRLFNINDKFDSNETKADMWVMKLTSKGGKSWSRVLGVQGQYDIGNDLIVHSDSSALVIGSGRVKGQANECRLHRVDKNGKPMWAKAFGKSLVAYCNRGLERPGGYVIFANGKDAKGNTTALVFGRKANGDADWQTTIQLNGWTNITTPTRLANGDIFLGGNAGPVDKNGAPYMALLRGNGVVRYSKPLVTASGTSAIWTIPLQDGRVLSGGRIGAKFGTGNGWMATYDAFGHASATAAGACCKHTLTNCDDGKPCTDPGCDPKKGCTAKNAPDKTVCADGKTCNAGSCS